MVLVWNIVKWIKPTGYPTGLKCKAGFKAIHMFRLVLTKLGPT